MKTWFVEFPTYRYEQDVQALALEHGLAVVDARFDDGTGVTDAPKLTLLPEYGGAVKTQRKRTEAE